MSGLQVPVNVGDSGQCWRFRLMLEIPVNVGDSG